MGGCHSVPQCRTGQYSTSCLCLPSTLPPIHWKAGAGTHPQEGHQCLLLLLVFRYAYVSSAFGPRWSRMHEGIDVAAEAGTPIKAVADGVIVFSGSWPVYGKLVEVDHGNGFLTRYAHCSRLLCNEGQVSKLKVHAVAMTQGTCLSLACSMCMLLLRAWPLRLHCFHVLLGNCSGLHEVSAWLSWDQQEELPDLTCTLKVCIYETMCILVHPLFNIIVLAPLQV